MSQIETLTKMSAWMNDPAYEAKLKRREWGKDEERKKVAQSGKNKTRFITWKKGKLACKRRR